MTRNRIALNLTSWKGGRDAKSILALLTAASEAGFPAIGLQMADVGAWARSDRKLRELLKIITDLGMEVLDLSEVSMCDEHGRVADRAREFCEAAALGAKWVDVVYNGRDGDLKLVRDHWAEFLDLVSDVEGVRGALRFSADSPFLSTLDRAWDIAGGGPSNGALLLDVYDFWRGESSAASLEGVPLELIGLVHLSDARIISRAASREEDRTIPGSGVMPLTYIVSTLIRRHYTGWFSVKLFDNQPDASHHKVAFQAFRSARRLLSTSGPSHRKALA